MGSPIIDVFCENGHLVDGWDHNAMPSEEDWIKECPICKSKNLRQLAEWNDYGWHKVPMNPIGECLDEDGDKDFIYDVSKLFPFKECERVKELINSIEPIQNLTVVQMAKKDFENGKNVSAMQRLLVDMDKMDKFDSSEKELYTLLLLWRECYQNNRPYYADKN